MAWFEIKAIRSWGAARTGHDGAGKAPGSTIAEPQRRELKDVLETYDRRCREVADRERTEAEDQERFREEAAHLLEAVILPALTAPGKEIAEHGHAWEVESRVDILGQPAVACTLSPRGSRGSEPPPSELVLRFHFPDRLLVTAASDDGTGIRELPPRSYEIAGVNAAVIQSEVTRFVRRVLEVAA